MRQVSEYERLQIESLLACRGASVQEGNGVFLMPEGERFGRVFEAAVLPAMQKNGLNAKGTAIAFESSSSLWEVGRVVQSAEVIVANVTGWNADLVYVLGLCHGLGRCPLLLAAEPIELPFNLMALRFVEYREDDEGLRQLRGELTRAIRVFLAAGRAQGDKQDRRHEE